MHHNTDFDFNFVLSLVSDNHFFPPSALQPLEFRTALLTFSGAKRASATHTFGDISLKLVEDFLNGLHMRLQALSFVRHTCQGSGQDRVQVEAQYAVHSVASKRGLVGVESSRMLRVSL